MAEILKNLDEDNHTLPDINKNKLDLNQFNFFDDGEADEEMTEKASTYSLKIEETASVQRSEATTQTDYVEEFDISSLVGEN